MNKNLHRVVFNAARGERMAVQETAASAGKSGGAGAKIMASAVLGATLVTSQAQIVGDRSAPGTQRPTVLNAGNGVPLVNIQTPSAAGVSRNTYGQFDVGTNGAILNNSRVNTQTQLGGWVDGNPWLAKGTARVILNEINSSNPSQLNGFIETAGDRAEVVVANPAGISVNGGGFINASRVTLTTGSATLNDGAITNYQVRGGTVSVQGQGLNATDADYLGIMARAVALNASVWAKDVKLTLGANDVRADQSQSTPIAGQGAAPKFALDSAALGGMYAGKITLVGTEAGVGVRNAGVISAEGKAGGAGTLALDIQGQLTNSGTVQAEAPLQLQAGGGVVNSGTISSQAQLQITTPLALDNSGGRLNAPRLDVSAGSLRNRDGAIEQTGNQALQLDARSVSNKDGGQVGGAPRADAAVSPDAAGAAPAPSTPNVSLADGRLRIDGALNNDSGHISAAGAIALDSQGPLVNDGGTLAVNRLRVTGDGTLIAGDELRMNLSGDLNNTGTIAGRKLVDVTAQNIRNKIGDIDGGDVLLKARQDLDNIGGSIRADNSLIALAGRNLNVESTTRDDQARVDSNTTASTHVDRVAGLYVRKAGGTLIASAGNDINLIGAAIVNGQNSAALQGTSSNGTTSTPEATSAGKTMLAAGNDLNFKTLDTRESTSLIADSRNYLHEDKSQELGTSIAAVGSVQLQAGRDINARAATINTDTGATTAIAGRDVNLTAGRTTSHLEQATYRSSRDLFGGSSTATRDVVDSDTAVGSLLGGSTVTVLAGRDVTVNGSRVLSDQGTSIVAGNNVSILAEQNRYAQTHEIQKKESGLLESGSMGLMYGSQELTTKDRSRHTTSVGSMVGSTAGDVVVRAGERYTQIGSDVLAPQGSVDLQAKRVDIHEARETRESVSESSFKQSGVTIALSAPLLGAAQTSQNMADASGKTSDRRMQALAVANTAAAVYDAATQIQSATSGLSASITVGSASASSKTERQSDTAAISTIAAGRDVRIVATGAGKDSDIVIQGTDIRAGRNGALFADDAITLRAAENTSSERSTNQSNSGGIGFAAGYSSSGVGFGITASTAAANGKSQGNGTSYTNTHIHAGDTLTIASGGTTSLRGAVVSGNKVVVDAGGLVIESLQDTNRYESLQRSTSASVTVGAGAGAGASGNASTRQTRVASDFKSVGEQSAIRAGDGGFDVKVNGATELMGGAITSTQAAVDAGVNRFASQTLTARDIQNRAAYSATGASVSAGSTGGSAGFAQQSGNASSATRAGISAIAGDTQARSGDAPTGLKPTFDPSKVQDEVDAGVQITAGFVQQAGQRIAAYVRSLPQSAEQQPSRTPQSATEANAAQGDADKQEKRAAPVESDLRPLSQEGGKATIPSGSGSRGEASGVASDADGTGDRVGTKVATSTSATNAVTPASPKRGAAQSQGTEAAPGEFPEVVVKASRLPAEERAGTVDATSSAPTRQLVDQERDLAIQLATLSNGKFTAGDIMDVLRRAGIKGTNIAPDTTGVIADVTEPGALRDGVNFMPIAPGSRTFIQTLPATDPDAVRFVQQLTGGEGSPYYWSAAATQAKESPSPIKVYTEPLYYQCASADCLLYGANYRNHVASFTEEQKRLQLFEAARVASLAGMATLGLPANTSAALVVAVNAGVRFLESGTVDPIHLIVDAGLAPLFVGGGGAVTNLMGSTRPLLTELVRTTVNGTILTAGSAAKHQLRGEDFSNLPQDAAFNFAVAGMVRSAAQAGAISRAKLAAPAAAPAAATGFENAARSNP